MLEYILVISVLLFITSMVGYIFSTLKEKSYLKNNMIIIDKKIVTQDHLNETDIKEFVLDGLRVKAGDEIRVITKGKRIYNGILIGAKKSDRAILMVTHSDEIKTFKVDNIVRLKILTKYGMFFK